MQSVSLTHCTQWSSVVSHKLLAPVHAVPLAAVHCTHWPANVPVVSHAGVVPLQSAAVQARQTSSAAAVADLPQKGVAPEHCAFAVQATQVPYLTLPLVVSQYGVVPLQPMPSSAAVQTRQPAGVDGPVQIAGTDAFDTMQAPAAFDHSFCTV